MCIGRKCICVWVSSATAGPLCATHKASFVGCHRDTDENVGCFCKYLFADGIVRCRDFAEKESLSLSLDAHRCRFIMDDPVALTLPRVAGPDSRREKIKCCHFIAGWRSTLYWHILIQASMLVCLTL